MYSTPVDVVTELTAIFNTGIYNFAFVYSRNVLTEFKCYWGKSPGYGKRMLFTSLFVVAAEVFVNELSTGALQIGFI
jgi:hypothetical protein